MTHSTINRDRENAGSLSTVYHTIDITSLDGTGTESYDPDAEVGISGADRFGVSVVGVEDDSKIVQWDHVAAELSVRNIADGSNAADNSDVGEVVLQVTGT